MTDSSKKPTSSEAPSNDAASQAAAHGAGHDAAPAAAEDRIAIVGIGCRLPGGASDHRAFWQNLIEGKDCLSATPLNRYDVRTLGSSDKSKPGRLVGGRGGYIDGFDEFDPAFFGISPREADYMDPQQRKLLEVSWEALEDGGLRPGQLAGQDIGVFVGAFTLDYKIVQFADLSFETLAAHTATGTMMTMASNRISYCFDFRGPSLSIDTACSSSLVAVHLACHSLRRRETSLALAGGTLLHMTPQYTIAETKGGFLSPEGKSRTFDAAANGYVRAEGVGIVALKRLDDALRDGDPIYAVIVGTGVNQDGHSNGITVPNPDAQVALIKRVCEEAGIEPGSLQYMEAHGTSTPVGDPIEARALGRALAIGRKPGDKCYVGSVKTNIGHTEAAAGVAGLIKTALALKHKTIPPHINLNTINPDIDLASMPYEIPTQVTAWPEHEGPARAGVNSFGFGGTNAHVLLEEAPLRESAQAAAQTQDTQPATASGAYNILPLTARDAAAFPELVAGIRKELARDGEDAISLQDLGYTLAHRRQHLDARLSFVYDSRDALDERLAAFEAGEAHPHIIADERRGTAAPKLAWVFTGMGPQWWAMGRQLFDNDPIYREVIEQCDRELSKHVDWSLIEEINAAEADSQMSDTWLAQPANFAVQIALAAMWRAKGIVPDAIVGHSTGEVAAFYAAGVYTLEQAVKVVVHRSRLQQKLVDTGSMLAVSLTEAEALKRVKPYGDRVSVAAVNSPTAITLAGDQDALAELAAKLQAEQLFAKFLTVRVPYHSAKMDLIKDELLQCLDGLAPHPAQLPLYMTAKPGIAQGHELDAGYWWENVRNSVGFRAAIDQMADDGFDLFLEIGPHPVLGHSINECFAARGLSAKSVPSIRRQEDEAARFAASLATLHNLGLAIDWNALHPRGRHVTLPRYPFKRDRYWVEPRPVEQIRLGQLDHPLLGRRMANAEPTWEAKLDAEHLPYLQDHRIQGNVLFPAAGYIEMAAQAVRAMTGGASAAIADIELRKALFLPDSEAASVQLSFSSDGAGFNVSTLSADGLDRTVHAAGSVRASQGQRPGPALDARAVRERSPLYLARSACYDALAAMGYHYGPAFQGIEEVWVGHGEALARIVPTEQLQGGAADHHFHPAMLDACFQALLTPQILKRQSGDADDSGIRLPLSIQEVRTDAIGDRALWVHALITFDGGDELIGDIHVYDEHGAPLGRVGGFRAANVENASAKVSLSTIDNWLADVQWIERSTDAADSAEAGETDGWLIFADEQGLGDELAALAVQRGERVHLVRPGKRYKLEKDLRESSVTPGASKDLQRLFADLNKTGNGRFGTIVHLWNLDQPTLDEIDARALHSGNSRGAYSLIALSQALASSHPHGRLHIVTRGTQAVARGDAVEPLGAPAWGIGRVLWYQELVGQRGKLIDLPLVADNDPTVRVGEAALLRREVLSIDEDEIALRDGKRYTSRLLPAAELTKPLPLRLRSDGAYLVTGAFGALGRLLCRTLVKRGARKLILVGRSKLPPRAQWRDTEADTTVGRNVRFLKELERLGAEPILAQLDITDEGALRGWLADYRQRDLPPIRGAFHLAGQVRDTLLAEMERETFDTVYDPKVVGGWLLHKYLADQPLEHFVLFASIASLVTTAGQSNYAAGNAFLDALAHHRRAQGLPALALDWGPWATGMIEELGLIDHYRNSRGMSSLSPDAGMDVLERVIGQDRAQLLVATVVDWPIFLAWYASPPPLVVELAKHGAGSGSSEHGSFVEAFRDADADTRWSLLNERFHGLIAQVMRIKHEQIDTDASLNALGLDSLLAMELRARIHTELKVALPVVTLLSSSSIGTLGEQLHAALIELVAADGQDDGSSQFIAHTDDTRYPLTQNQNALWFLKQLNPDGFAYNIGGAVEVRAELEPELMFAAVRVLIARHPSLRANFMLDQGQAVQKISAEGKYDIALFDAQDKSWDEIYQQIIREYRKPYDLEHDALVRFRLFKRGKDRWVIMKAVHHIISDAISTFTFIEELLAVYEGLRRGEKVELAPVRSKYLDFLNWQNKFLAGRDAAKMLGYWRDHLPEQVPILALPTDKPRPIVQTHNGASEFFTLDTELSARIHSLARENGVTVFMVLLSAYYILLHRYTGQDDVIVGSPVMGRTQEEFAQVYGYFVNPLPLHVNLAAQPSISEILAQVQQIVLNGLDNQEYPFVLLVEKLGLQHDPSRSAVFQAMFILLSHKVATEKYGYRLEYIELPEEEGQFDLTLSAYEDEADQRFHCVFKYNTDLFHAQTVQRLASHYVNLLDELARAPADSSIAQLQLLGADERRTVLEHWSGAEELADAARPVHRLIAQIAKAKPDSIAVTAPSESGDTRQLSYGELERRSNRLARKLRELGVRDGAVVALCLDKSPELIVTLLAVLKAGGAYLPLDPDYPSERLAYMASHAGAQFAVVDEERRERLAGWNGEVLTPDDLHLIADADTDASPVDFPVEMNHTAYVIYTSGSTGKPKAVRVTHANLASAYAGWEREYRLDETRAHLQMASFSFDVFAGDLVRALCSGSTLVLITRELLFNTQRLYQIMLDQRVDAGEFVPAVVRGVMDYCEREGKRLDFMRLLIVGSDVWKVEEYRRLRALAGADTRVINSYGLSEATIDSTYFEGDAADLEASRMVPIGRAFPNSALYILDAHQQPVPAGVPGELWIGGSGVSAGYVGDDEQTAQRFRELPLGRGGQPRRVYRSGDLARWSADGEVQLIGRADNQVKVRGHRVEIGEIESQLAAWPAIGQTVISVREDANGETALCAYCIAANDGERLNWRALREHLAAYLPTFMIPTHYVQLGAFPLSANGKVDLAALPAPDGNDAQAEFEAPVTLYEVRMAEHWKQLLGLEQVGLQHDFFEVGGSSIKLIELIYNLQTEFNIAIAVSQLFKVTTLHGMAKTVEAISLGRVAGAQPYLRFNQGRSHEQTIFCFPPAGGHGLVYRQLAVHMPEYEFVSFNYILGDEKIASYADLIESIHAPDGHCTLFGYSLGGNLAFEVAKELERRGREVPNVVIMDSYRIPESFELGNEHFEAFERELTEHLRKHTGSEIVAQETLEQAKDYIRFCSQTPNIGVIAAPVSVISDEDKLVFYGTGHRGTWHGSSTTRSQVYKGFGKHADMLDHNYIALNAALARDILVGGQTNAA
ncbi:MULTISPECIES: HSAF biosynthetic non-ribosomal peptide synthetase/polyketide synthase [Lysobacter]|uniref:HSAF biosynthetic non-ribosomal peptide synthetase/polyketide synthase n=1 Tax=Lysobacter TaxID=68 RepID=UPI001F455A2D|nr:MULTISPECIES: HSAF biosynthetic non-ribosomal peptide synthetase/polyketide synthase [Lysobacter]UJB20890.1 HSAF biosynthetic non-ribosomal peptide synthetase/polyketide synthase [Lysobacter capsici]UJQ29996.1 HSAF biosynthetic non-ribosomal peptide synthetase/polyketide synthase [Lysobacter gummosus]